MNRQQLSDVADPTAALKGTTAAFRLVVWLQWQQALGKIAGLHGQAGDGRPVTDFAAVLVPKLGELHVNTQALVKAGPEWCLNVCFLNFKGRSGFCTDGSPVLIESLGAMVGVPEWLILPDSILEVCQ